MDLTAIPSDIIQSHILNRLDGSALASTTCASPHLSSLCNDDRLWKHICNSTWPSTTHPRVRDAISTFPSAHRSFYSDSFPAAVQSQTKKLTSASSFPELISAVDVYFDGKLIYSKVMETETVSGWFTSSPFRFYLLDLKETVIIAMKADDDGSNDYCVELANRLRLSWILIDPANKRAVNVASSRAVEARRNWLTEDLQLRFATVVHGLVDGDLVQFSVMVTCGSGKELHLKEVNMQVEDMEGKIVSGRDGSVILQETMAAPRGKAGMEKESYQEFLRMNIRYRERTERRERVLDMSVMVTAVTTLLAMLIYFLCK